MRVSFISLFFIVLLILKPASAAYTLPPSATIPAGAVGLSLIALMFSINIVAIGFILSKIFPNTGIDGWLRGGKGQGEYWEIAKTAILIVLIYSIVAFVTNISTFFAPPVSGSACTNPAPVSYTLVNAACQYLNSVKTHLGDTYNFLFGLSSTLGALNSLSVSIFLPIPTPIVSFKFGFEAKPYVNSMLLGAGGQFSSLLNDMITIVAFPVSLLVVVQMSMLPFIFMIGLAGLIPMGLVLRAMPFTRNIGGTLVALGLGVSVIYPSVLIIFNYPITSAFQDSVYASSSMSCGAGDLFCSFISAVLSNFNNIGIALQSLYTILPALNYILNYSSYLLLQLLLFILDLGIGLALTEKIANSLGGTIKLSIGGKIKLV